MLPETQKSPSADMRNSLVRSLVFLRTRFSSKNKIRSPPVEDEPAVEPAVEPCLLLELPLEIILEVFNHLDADSAALFALTCRPVLFALGPQNLKAAMPVHEIYAAKVKRTFGYSGRLRSSPHERCTFLDLIAKDVPGYFPCQLCGTLHSIAGDFRRTARALKYRGCARYYIRIANFDSFSFALVQHAMQRHRNGLGFSDILAALAESGANKYVLCESPEESSTAESSIPPNLIGERSSQRLLISTTSTHEVPQSIPVVIIKACRHIVLQIRRWTETAVQVRCVRSNTIILEKLCPRYYDSLSFKCQDCHSEWRIRPIRQDGFYETTEMTTWVDIGDGSMHGDALQRHLRYTPSGKVASVEEGEFDIRAAFEEETARLVALAPKHRWMSPARKVLGSRIDNWKL